MKEELDYYLVKRFPTFFKNRYSSPQESCMHWGFECGEGWFKILYQACSLVENHIDNIKENNEFRLKMKNEIESGAEVYENWKKEYAKNKLEPVEVPQFVASQVKEKFGTLRFYYQGGDDYIRAIINSAESSSAHTCETCGNPGKLREGGWITTLCDKHAEEQGRLDEEENKYEVGDTIKALVEGDIKYFVIKEVKEREWIGKEVEQKYDKVLKDYVKIESEENYRIKKYENEIFTYFDAIKIES